MTGNNWERRDKRSRERVVKISVLASDIVKEHASQLTEDFTRNKEFLEKMKPPVSKSEQVLDVLASEVTQQMMELKKRGL